MSDLLKTLKGSKDLKPPKDSASAVLALKEILEATLDNNQKTNNSNPLAALDDRRDPDKRTAAIVTLSKALTGKSLSTLVLDWMARVNTKSPREVAIDLETEFGRLLLQQKPLLDYAATKVGAAALAGIATVDLVVGMDDRLVEAFNGDNFDFNSDGNELWCIDNAKKDFTSLSTADEEKWKNWVRERAWMRDKNTKQASASLDKGKSFAEIFHWTIYDKVEDKVKDFTHSVDLSPEQRDATAAGVEESVAATLQKLQDIVDDNTNGLPKAIRDRLRARLEFVEARNRLSNLLDFSDFIELPTIAKPWFGKKIGRKLVRGVLGATDEEKLGEGWKETARKEVARKDGANEDDLTAQDNNISQYIADRQGQKIDDRILKALFATRAARLVAMLESRTNGKLDSDGENISKIVELGKTTKAWGKFDPSVVDSLAAIAEQWRAALKKNDDEDPTAARVEAAMRNFTQQFSAHLN
jgi:hypothetical protein